MRRILYASKKRNERANSKKRVRTRASLNLSRGWIDRFFEMQRSERKTQNIKVTENRRRDAETEFKNVSSAFWSYGNKLMGFLFPFWVCDTDGRHLVDI